MRKLFILFVLIPLTTNIYTQNFIGSAHYTSNLDLPDFFEINGELIEEAVKNEIAMSDTFSMHFYNGMLKYVIGGTHYVYNDTINYGLEQFDLNYSHIVEHQNINTKEFDALVKIELLPEKELVNGIECQSVLIHFPTQTDQYWFNTDYFPINTKHLANYTQTSLGYYFKNFNNIPIKYDIANGFLSGLLIAIEKDLLKPEDFYTDFIINHYEVKKERILDQMIEESIESGSFKLVDSYFTEKHGFKITLDSLPNKLTNVQSLRDLKLEGVDLLSLGNKVANLENLENLDLGYFRCAYAFGIPENEFKKLKNLKKLKALTLGSSCHFINKSGIEQLNQIENIYLPFLQEFPNFLFNIDFNVNVHIMELDYNQYEKEFIQLKKNKKNLTILFI